MIPINRVFNPLLPSFHHQAIKNYLAGSKMKKKFTRIESMLDELTGGKYNFEKFVQAPFSEIENTLVPAWHAFPARRKTHYAQSIKLFGNLYTYLGIEGYYKYQDPSGATINHCTNHIFTQLKIKTCPYCNENYTYYFNQNGKRNYDLDHFFPQKTFPILAVCFFNLIPSCKVCNFFKLHSNEPFLSPYHSYRINDIITWGLKVHSANYLFDESQFEIIIRNSTTLNYLNRINNNVRLLHLQERYEHRKDIVSDTLKKKQLYNDDYLEQLFQNYEGVLFRNFEQVKTLLFNATMNEEDYSQRPFSKLVNDILNSKH